MVVRVGEIEGWDSRFGTEEGGLVVETGTDGEDCAGGETDGVEEEWRWVCSEEEE